MRIDRLRASWPHIRAVLLSLYVLVMLVHALPEPLDCYNENAEREDQQAPWVQHYLHARRAVIRPFRILTALTGERQGWRMFANPRYRAVTLHIDVFEEDAWRAIHRTGSDRYDYWRDKLEHNRFRKLLARASTWSEYRTYNHLVTFLARRVFADHPGATMTRIGLYRYDIPEPEDVRAGVEPVGEYDRVFVFNRAEFP